MRIHPGSRSRFFLNPDPGPRRWKKIPVGKMQEQFLQKIRTRNFFLASTITLTHAAIATAVGETHL
jgi:hypothetical protein